MEGPQRVTTGLHLYLHMAKHRNTKELKIKTTKTLELLYTSVPHLGRGMKLRAGGGGREEGCMGGTVILIQKSQSWWGAVECHYQSTETRSRKTKISTLPLNIKNNTTQGQGLRELNKQEVHSRACQAAIHTLSLGWSFLFKALGKHRLRVQEKYCELGQSHQVPAGTLLCHILSPLPH